MIRRILALAAIIWFVGFGWFTIALPEPVSGVKTTAVIVPTGAAGRIEHGLKVLANGEAKTMLVTGVDPEVKPGEFAAQFEVPMDVMQCCVELGFSAVDTRGNATETAEWVKQGKVKSLRLVTTDWHMRRAAYELRQTIPGDVKVVEDAVPSEPSLRILFLEYHKYLASRTSSLWRG
ncbi:YdcF family protein [Pontixanthobacter gangjinensis]|uniref:YdcF family protein n=1 Tax=Pontixanthobacter gangjinensis TaxID=1028742 RepID=A0A6I4SIC6_9SPHN|nr:YdcF family protein [Pontixanthobacter gangjinensis]MXO55333.1 YdcF family protein [Pontixanthobacter gangjinensis]